MKEVTDSRFSAQTLAAGESFSPQSFALKNAADGLWVDQLIGSPLEPAKQPLPEAVVRSFRLSGEPGQAYESLREYALAHPENPCLGIGAGRIVYIYYQESLGKITLFCGRCEEHVVLRETPSCTFAALVVDEAFELTLVPPAATGLPQEAAVRRKGAEDLLIRVPDQITRPRQFFAVLFFNVYRHGLPGVANCCLKTEWVATPPQEVTACPAAAAADARPDFWSYSRETAI